MDGLLIDSVYEAPRVTGAVLWFRDDLGYGFIMFDETEHFVHYTQIDMDGYKALDAGQVVTFSPATGPRGPYCVAVRVSK